MKIVFYLYEFYKVIEQIFNIQTLFLLRRIIMMIYLNFINYGHGK